MTLRKADRRAFTLVELVVVIVIIGILAAVAIPRLSRGSGGASESALLANLATVRNAIQLYAAEHQGTFPGPDADGFASQLTQYTNLQGATSATRSSTHRYGPYLLAIPPCPVGEAAGTSTATDVLISTASPPTPIPANDKGWVYNVSTGEFVANTLQVSETGVVFNEL